MLSKDEAINMLNQYGNDLMENLNYQFIAVVRIGDSENHGFHIGALNSDELVIDLKNKVNNLNTYEISDERNKISACISLTNTIPFYGLKETNSNKKRILIAVENIAPKPKVNQLITRTKPTIGLRKGGDDISHYKIYNSFGTIGSSIRAKTHENDNDLFLVTNYHVVNDGNAKIDDPILSPSYKNDNQRAHLNQIGTLWWYEKSEYYDIALVKAKKNRIAFGTNHFNIKPNFGHPPKENDLVKTCGYYNLSFNPPKEKKILSTYCYIREKEGSKYIMKGVYQCENIAQNGDSGALVVNTANEVVGVLTHDQGTKYTYFTNLNILQKPITTPLEGKERKWKFISFN